MARLHTVIDVPSELHASTAEFWQRALGWQLGDPWPGHPELRSFEPRGAPYVHLQEVDGTPRVHIDVESEDSGRASPRPPLGEPWSPAFRAMGGAAVARRVAVLRAAGRQPGRVRRGDGGWHVLGDLAGLPFCVTENSPEQTRRRDLS